MRARKSPEALAQRWDHRIQLTPVPLDVGDEDVLIDVASVVAECLDEGTIRRCEILIAPPEQHAGSGVKSGLGQLGRERRLSHPRLTRDQHHLAPFPGRNPPKMSARMVASAARPTTPTGGVEHETPRERHAADDVPVVVEGFPRNLEHLNFLREPLQGKRTERVKRLGRCDDPPVSGRRRP